MKFKYNKETGVFSVYVKQKEFDLAVSPDDKYKSYYRVMSRDFTKTDLEVFVQEFSKFSVAMMNAITTSEDGDGDTIQDVVMLSTHPEGYSWTSLLKLHETDDAETFLDLLMTYAESTFHNQASQRGGKIFHEEMAEIDLEKLDLIRALISSVQYNQPWKPVGKSKFVRGVPKTRLQTVKRRIAAFEKQFGFNTQEMLKYYLDDSIPDKKISDWIALTKELESLDAIQGYQNRVGEVMKVWMDSD